jgi:hypothetical protein
VKVPREQTSRRVGVARELAGRHGRNRLALAGVRESTVVRSGLDQLTVAVRCALSTGRTLGCAAVQPRPTAAELLAVVAEVLERDIVPALDGPVQHHARVAANLVAIVERELRFAPAAAAAELSAVDGLLQVELTDLDDARAQLAAALRSGLADDPNVAEDVWGVLMRVARDDLAISKPGHDSWEGE